MNALQSLQALSPSEQSALQMMINVLLQSSALLLLALIAGHLLRRARPTLQALICRGALAGVAALVAATLLSSGRIEPTWNLAAPQPSSTTTTATTTIIESDDELNSPPPAPASLENTSITPELATPREAIPASAPQAEIGIYSVVKIIWISATSLLLAWLALCHFHVARLRKGSTPLRHGETFQLLQELCATLKMRAPLLLVSARASSPFLAGLRNPAIFLPATYEAEFDKSALRAVLIHELAHLQRHDCWWNLLARLSCALLWPQPLLWLLCRRMEHSAEDVCDIAVVQDGCSPQQYAGCLLDLAERLTLRPTERVAGVGVLPVRSALGRRVQQILDSSRRGTIRLSPRLRAGVSLAMFSIVAAITMLITVQIAPGEDRTERPQFIDLSSPKAAIESYYAALNEGNKEGAYSCLFGRPVGGIDWAAVDKAIKSLKGSGRSLTIRDLHTTQVMPGYATAVVRVVPQGRSKQAKLTRIVTGTVHIYLRREGDKWQIVEEPLLARGNPATISGRLVDKDGRPAAGVPLIATMTSGQDRQQATRRVGPKTPEEYRALYRMCSAQDRTQPDGTFAFTGLTTGRYRISLIQRTQKLMWPPRRLPALGDVSVQEGKRIHVAIRHTSTFPSRVNSPRGISPALNSPESTIHSFVVALNRGVFKQAASYVSGADPGALTTEHEQKLKQSRWNFSTKVLRVTQRNDQATVALDMIVQGQIGKSMVKMEGMRETLSLVREGADWKIAPQLRHRSTTSAKGMKHEMNRFGLNLIALSLAHPDQKDIWRNMAFMAEGRITVKSPRPTPKPQPSRIPRTTATITGRIIYEDGSPVQGLNVTTQPRDEEKLRSRLSHMVKYSQRLTVSDTTAANGTYRLSRLAPAVYDFQVADRRSQIRGTYLHLLNSHQGVITKMGKTAHARDIVLLKRSAVISGKVVDKVTGKPLSGILIFERGPHAPGSPISIDYSATLTEKTGHYTLRVAPGTSSFGVGYQGLADQKSPSDRTQRESIVASTSGAKYARDNGVEVIVDGGQVESSGSGVVRLAIRKGQTRTVTFRLKKLK